MLKYSHKKAFTVAELVLSLLIFGIGTACITTIINNDNKAKKIAAQPKDYFICYKGKTEDTHGGRYYSNINGCNFEITPEISNKEFFELRLIGGGGGATNLQSGTNGEEKVVNYISLNQPFRFKGSINSVCNSPFCSSCNDNGECTSCVEGYKFDNKTCKPNFYYRAILGEGGKVNQNGGQTSLIVIDKTSGKILKIIETAAGGIISNSSESLNSSIMSSSTSDYGSGNGGMAPDGEGKSGEVKISW